MGGVYFYANIIIASYGSNRSFAANIRSGSLTLIFDTTIVSEFVGCGMCFLD